MKILFVCTGNTCRSIMAEYLFNNINKNLGFMCSSAGISIVKGSVVTNNSATIIKKEFNENVKNRMAVQLREEQLMKADLVLTMTEYGKEYIKEYFSKYANKIFTLGEFVGEVTDITDPYGSSLAVYEKTYKEIKLLVNKLLDMIEKEESVK